MVKVIQATRESMDHVELASFCLFLLLSKGQMCVRPLKASALPAKIHRPIESLPFYLTGEEIVSLYTGVPGS